MALFSCSVLSDSVTPMTEAYQASLVFTIFWSWLKLMSIKSVMPSISSSVLPFSSPLQSFPASGSFPMSLFFASSGQSIWALASASVLSINIQDWFPLGWTGLISLQSKGLSRTPQFKSINSSVLSFLYGPTLTSVHDYWKNHRFDYMDLCWQSNVSVFNTLSRFIIAILPRSKRVFKFHEGKCEQGRAMYKHAQVEKCNV